MTIEEERVSFAGTMRITAELDLADALDFGAAVTHGAETLKALGSAEGLDARRAAAVGEMAGHQRSLDVAAGFETGLRPSSTSDAMLLVAGFETGLGPSSTSDVLPVVAGFETGLRPSSTSDALLLVAGFETGLGPSSTSDVLPVVAGFEPGASATLARMGGEDDAMSVYDADWARLRDAARGRDVLEAEALVRGWAGTHARYITDLDVALMARVMSDPRWSRRHPLSAIVLAWRHRGSRPVHRTLRQLWRPRFAG